MAGRLEDSWSLIRGTQSSAALRVVQAPGSSAVHCGAREGESQVAASCDYENTFGRVDPLKGPQGPPPMGPKTTL